MDFIIVQELTWNCRILDVKMKTNRSNRSKFVVAKLAKADTGEFLCSYLAHELSFFSFETFNTKYFRHTNIITTYSFKARTELAFKEERTPFVANKTSLGLWN